mgnify:CR=1 FL=1
MTIKLLRRPVVQERTALSRSTLYALVKAGKFPKPVKLNKRAVAWVESEIDAWLKARMRMREMWVKGDRHARNE